MDRASRTGVTGAVSASDLELIRGGGPQGADDGAWIVDLYLGFDGVNGMQI